jgi:hypothetical protein
MISKSVVNAGINDHIRNSAVLEEEIAARRKDCPFPIEGLTEIRFHYMMRKRREVWWMWECQLTKRAIVKGNHQ